MISFGFARIDILYFIEQENREQENRSSRDDRPSSLSDNPRPRCEFLQEDLVTDELGDGLAVDGSDSCGTS